MNNKDLVAKAVYDAVKDDLTLEQVEQLLENPKSAEHGDVAFPAFSLAKVYRKAPQQIAADLAEKIDSANFEKIEVVGPYLNFFMNKELISKKVLQTVVKEKNIMGIAISGIKEQYQSTCLLLILPNQSQWDICVRQLSVIRSVSLWKKSVISQSASTI